MASKILWSRVDERMEKKKLSTWKANYPSLGDRITLIKAALANPPISFMTLFICRVEGHCFGATVKVLGVMCANNKHPLCANLPKISSVSGLDNPRTLLLEGPALGNDLFSDIQW